jgi:hypothetical protein
MSLKIEKIKTNKSKIKLRPYMEQGIIPKHPFRCILNSISGGGKTTLLMNLMTKPQFYKGYFDETYIYSPTIGVDDSFEDLHIDEDHILSNLDDLRAVIDIQKQALKKKPIHKVAKVLIIFEDMQSSTKVLNNPDFVKLYLMGRHFSISTFFTSQHFKKTPKAVRSQATDLFLFQGNENERRLIIEEFTPPMKGFTKKDMIDLMDYVFDKPYNFMYINMTQPFKTRYRKNLGEILEL